MASNARPQLRRTLLALAACGALSGTTQAATVVWNGIGMNDQWMPTTLGPVVASNWLRNGIAAGPQNGDDLLFNSNVRTVSSNDYAALEVRSITFDGAAANYTLGGNALRVTDSVAIHNDAPQHLGMRVTASRSFRYFGGGGRSSLLFLDGGMDMDDGADSHMWSTVVDQGSDSLVIGKSAASSLELSGLGTTVKAGTVIVGKSGGAAAGTSALKLDGLSDALPEVTVSATSRVVVGQNAPGRIDTSRGLLSSPFVTLGDGAGISGKAVLNGDGARWQVSDTLEVGRSGTGTLSLSGKAQIDTERAVLAAQPTGTATVTLKDAGTRLSVARDLYVGFQNVATVSVLNGALLDATTAYLGWTPSSSATVRVAGGGAILRSTTATVGADGNATLTLETGGTGQFGNLSIHDRGTVIVDGGRLEATTVQMRGGTLRSAAGLDLDVVGNLQGHGVVDGPVQRGAARTLTAEGGTLTLGDSHRGDGFTFDGALEVNGTTAVLLDADAAGLGHTTTLRDFSLLQADNGLVLGAGRLLQSFGDTRVAGRLLNDGSVRSEGGQL
ncbi:MAG: hypothetical protein KDG57_22375, partial [Rhodoferax sp.]|nr:hypothetical protein [Rhodoferax sp.]